MTKIWFSIAMTFNTSLFVSILLLLVLPNAKYVSMKRSAAPKTLSSEDTTDQKQAANKEMQQMESMTNGFETSTSPPANTTNPVRKSKLRGLGWNFFSVNSQNKTSANSSTTVPPPTKPQASHNSSVQKTVANKGFDWLLSYINGKKKSPQMQTMQSLSATAAELFNNTGKQSNKQRTEWLYSLIYGGNKTSDPTTTPSSSISTTEEKIDILDYEDPGDMSFLTNNSQWKVGNGSAELTTFHDYEVNTDEFMATEPPEMDTLAELVDENGQVEAADEDYDSDQSDQEHTTVSNSEQSNNDMTTDTTPAIADETIATTKKIKYAEFRRADPNVIAAKLVQIYQQKQLEKNLTETAKKRTCLQLTEDSGYWCEGSVGRLEIRYYYEKETESCECFLYYGCFGNKNNFDSVKECQDFCKPYTSHGFKKHTTGQTLCTITP